MDTSTDVRIDDRGNGHISVTIDRAQKHNALSRAVLEELSTVIKRYGENVETRFIVIRGAGDRYFAAGGDLVDLASVRTPKQAKAMSKDARRALDAIRNCKVPVIAYLNGNAIGGGAELALACDMRMIAASARIGYIQAKLAITPAWGGGTDLCTLIGAPRALRMLARCEMIDAQQALHWGLADVIVHDGPDGADVQEFLQPLLARSNQVMRAIKRQTRAWRTHQSYVQRRETEQQDLIATWTHDDHWRAAEGLLSKAKQ